MDKFSELGLLLTPEEILEIFFEVLPEHFPEEGKELLTNFVKIRRELTKESDRGSALLAVSMVEERLERLLKKRLIGTTKFKKELFEGMGPLATFSAKIKMCYSLGLIPKAFYDELNLIKSIRNEFAHKPAILQFADESISAKCNQLKLAYDYKSYTFRDKFINSIAGIMGVLEGKMHITKPIDEPEEINHKALATTLMEHFKSSFQSSKSEEASNE